MYATHGTHHFDKAYGEIENDRYCMLSKEMAANFGK